MEVGPGPCPSCPPPVLGDDDFPRALTPEATFRRVIALVTWIAPIGSRPEAGSSHQAAMLLRRHAGSEGRLRRAEAGTRPQGNNTMTSRTLLRSIVVALTLAASTLPTWRPSNGGEPKLHAPELRVARTDDFEVNGRGDSAAWEKVPWEPLHLRSSDGSPYETRVKMLYSATGLYVLMDAADRRITATMDEDFADLWNEDVFEFFLWPDERYPVYFEYEISPLGFELPILIPNLDGQFLGWRPWHYEGPRKTRKATTVAAGPKQPGAEVTGWKAEVFVPYDLLKPLRNVPPKPGTRWRANFYRMDYDGGRAASWDWARVGRSFHEFREFGTLVFE